MGAGDLNYPNLMCLPSEQSVGQQLVSRSLSGSELTVCMSVCVFVCVCVCAARKESLPAYGSHSLKDRKEESKKSKAWKSSKWEGLFWCVFAFLSVLVKGELLNGSGGEEHLKLNEALRKTHTGSHNKKSCKSEMKGVEGKLTDKRKGTVCFGEVVFLTQDICIWWFCTGNKWNHLSFFWFKT